MYQRILSFTLVLALILSTSLVPYTTVEAAQETDYYSSFADPLAEEASLQTDIVSALLEMPVFADSGHTPITELFEFPDFSVIDTIVPTPVTVFNDDGSYYTITASHEEAWANVLYEIDRIAWEFIATNPEFAAYVQPFSVEDDGVIEVLPFFLPQLSPDMHMARDLNEADGMSLLNRTLNLELGRQATNRAVEVYPNDLCRQDTLRHFTWARLAAQTFGAQSAQMVTNNHEWANAIGAHFGRQEYRNSALTILRRQALFEIASAQFGVPGQSMGFIDVFDADNVHDFWNNRAGINSVGDGFTDPVDAFREAERQGRLIMSDRDVTQSQTMDIFYSRWPFHNIHLPNPIQVTLILRCSLGLMDEQRVVIREGEDVILPADPVHPDYYFLHWAAACGTPISQLLASNVRVIVLYAQWISKVPPEVVLTFSNNDGTTVYQYLAVPIDTLFSQVLSQITAPVHQFPQDYTFIGWFTAPTGGAQLSPTHVVNAPFTLYAQWAQEPRPYRNIRFLGNGGTPNEQVATVNDNDPTYSNLISQVKEPWKTDYIFLGWFTAPVGGVAVQPGNTVAHLAIYAQWAAYPPPQEIILTFHRNDSTAIIHNRIIVPVDTPFGDILPQITEPVHLFPHDNTFIGWFTAPTGGTQLSPTHIVNAHLSLYAQWEREIHPHRNVRFLGNGGMPNEQIAIIRDNDPTYGNLISQVKEPRKTGYTFLGWFTAPVGGVTVQPGNTVSRLAIYAQWEADPILVEYIDVTFNGNGGSPASQTVSVPAGASLGDIAPPAIPVRDSYTFLGWAITPGGSPVSLPDIVMSSPLSLYAQWEVEVRPHRMVKFLGNGGTPSEQIAIIRDNDPTYGNLISQVEEPWKTGYTFLGWYIEPVGGVAVQPSNTAARLAIYAQWKANPVQAELTLTFRCSIYQTEQRVVVLAGATFAQVLPQVADPVRDGYVFIGWSATPGGSLLSPSHVFNAPITLFAVWEAETFPLAFCGNGGTPAMQGLVRNSSATYGDLIAQVTQPTKAGHTFLGWFTQPTGGVAVQPDDIASHLIIFAQWRAVVNVLTPQSPPAPQSSPLPASESSGNESGSQQQPSSQLPLLPLVRQQQQSSEPTSSDHSYVIYDVVYDEYDVLDDAPPLPISIPSSIPAPPAQLSINRLIFTKGTTQYLLNNQPRTSIGAPFIDPATNRMMIPLRTMAEATGATAEWCNDTRSALIHLPTGTLTLPAGQQLLDGMGIPVMLNDRVFIPLRFVMYAFNATVEWDSANRAAIIIM